MQLKRLHILRWQTFCLFLFLVLLGSSLTRANFSAQTVPVDEAANPSPPADELGPATPNRPHSDSDMPDITGTWRVKFVPPIENPITHAHFEIRRVQQGEIDFLIDMPWVKEFSRFSITWSAARQRFEGEFNEDDDENRSTVTLQPLADRNSLRVIITNRISSTAKQPDPAYINSDKTEEYMTQIWTRTSMTLATFYPAEEFGQPEATPLAESPTQTTMPGAQRGTGAITSKDVAPQSSAVPDTPAAKQLVEQLEAQESAAASAANEIRRLQANGSAVETVEPHQAQLKGHLQTAFELKMQLEELQVQELQSRLSRLERQIGQRKVLREKIIARRAADLLNPDMNWNTTTNTAPAAVSSVAETSDPELEGEWRLESISGTVGHETNLKARIVGSKWDMIRDGEVFTIGLKVDPTKSPKTIDMIVIGVDGTEFSRELGIYQIQNETLRIAWSAGSRNGSRPTSFDPNHARIHLWKRIGDALTSPTDVNSDSPSSTDPQNVPDGLTVTLPLIVGRYSEELLQSQVGFSGISLYAENVPVTTNDGKSVRATVVLAHDCRLDSFEPIQGSDGQLWAAKFHVLQGEQAEGSHQEITQERVTHLAEAGAIFVLDQMRSNADNRIRTDADNPVEMSAAVPKVLQIRLRCDRQMSTYKGLVGANVVIADNGQVAIMSVSPGRQMEFSFVEGVENSRGPFLLSFQYNGTDTTATTWLANNVLPIEFLAGDQDCATSGQLVEKAIYLDSASGALKTISSHTIEPGVDPGNVAATKGIVIGVVRISKGTVRPVGVDETRNADSTPKNAKPPNTNSKEPRTTSSAGSDPNTDLPGHTIEPAFPKNTFVNDESVPGIESLAAAADSASLQDTEMGSFQGTWCFDVLQSDAWPKPIGEPTDSSGRKSQQRWIIKGDLITWTSLDNEQIEVSFTIDPTKTPKQIDFTFLSGPQKGMKSIGIYEPQKGNADYVWLCMTNPGTDAPRPTKVDYSTEKQQSMIGIYPVAQSEIPEVAVYLQRFQGDWQMTLCDSTLEGFGSSQDEVKKWTWTIRGDEILWSRNGEAWQLKIDADPAKTPGELDLTYLTGPHKGSKCLGMYQWGGVDQSQLMIAIQDPGSDAPRPTKFSMSSDLKTGLMILEPRRADLK